MNKRIKKKYIPWGEYCYSGERYNLDNGKRIAVKRCPFYRVKNGICQCKLLHIIDKDRDILLWDSVKECTVHLGDKYGK